MDKNIIDNVFPGIDKNLFQIVKTRLDSFQKSLNRSGLEISYDQQIKSDLIKVFLFSEFIASCFTKNPQLFKDLIDSRDLFKTYSKHTYKVRLEKKITPDIDIRQVKHILLQTKLYETIRIAWRDLTGRALLDQTLFDLSNLADAVVETATSTLYENISQSHGLPVDSEGNFQKIIVLGMGKLGASELNFSSDIDLIFVYPESGYTNGEKIISNEEFFTILCRRFLRFFSPEASGINFYRVDTRLRPYGDSGPLVMSSSAFEEYYNVQGRQWERYAMIKARPVAGDIEAGARLLKTLNSFIYRRYFDYGSFDSFREMKNKIALQVKNRKLQSNIKLGAGGIREIEFFGQLFQMIRAGIEPELQEQKILKVLDLLQTHNCINRSVKQDLKKAYRFLRMVENRLQIYADLQTHDIPENHDRQKILALSMGYDAKNAFIKDLKHHMKQVHFHFSQLLVSTEDEGQDSKIEDLKELWVNISDPGFDGSSSISIEGFKNPDKVLRILQSLEEHPNTKRLTSSGRKKLARLIPVLIIKIGRQNESDAVLVRLIDLIITIERRTCYLSLLIENKNALETLIILAQKSPWIISFLSKHPALLDELMNPATLYSPPGKQALEKEMETRMAGVPSGDVEFLLEELCNFRQVNYLRIAAADVSGNYPLMKVSDHLTYIAQTVLGQVLSSLWHIMTQKYGFPGTVSDKSLDQCGFAIIAYGKVGGFEMGYKSDIDIVFLYKGESGFTKGGKKDIEIVRFYSNLGQRIINALTMHTPAGTLYGADMRLRPGGSSGMIVSHIDEFEEYMQTRAWTWEHQALIKARPVAGDKKLYSRFNKIRKNVLIRKRDCETLKKQVSAMREKMRKEHLKPKKNFFDLKQSKGCIVDIEFLVQYLILQNGHACPDIIFWTDNVRLLESLDAEGIIKSHDSGELQKTYVLMRRAVHRLNLQEKSRQIPKTHFLKPREHVIKMYDQHLSG